MGGIEAELDSVMHYLNENWQISSDNGTIDGLIYGILCSGEMHGHKLYKECIRTAADIYNSCVEVAKRNGLDQERIDVNLLDGSDCQELRADDLSLCLRDRYSFQAEPKNGLQNTSYPGVSLHPRLKAARFEFGESILHGVAGGNNPDYPAIILDAIYMQGVSIGLYDMESRYGSERELLTKSLSILSSIRKKGGPKACFLEDI